MTDLVETEVEAPTRPVRVAAPVASRAPAGYARRMSIEIQDDVTAGRVEAAYRRAKLAQQRHEDNFARTGLRAARARDPKLLLVLEKAANVLDRMAEDQLGRTRRTTDIYAFTVEPTEVQMWKKAYEVVDKGIHADMHAFAWVLGGAAVLCGYQS